MWFPLLSASPSLLFAKSFPSIAILPFSHHSPAILDGSSGAGGDRLLYRLQATKLLPLAPVCVTAPAYLPLVLMMTLSVPGLPPL